MKDLTLTENKFDQNATWDKPITFIPITSDLDLFDQNGYDLTNLEIQYSYENNAEVLAHRSHRTALKQPWFVQLDKNEGAILNHSLLFERKGYGGEALKQLKRWADRLPIIHKIIAIRSKWGLDFSMDYVDRDGNAFEVLHWEYDGFNYNEIEAVKTTIEDQFISIDWDDAAKSMLAKKEEWHHLDFFAQSDWKCNYFGVPKERFKMVIWE